ncbi:hypothetical protein ACOZGD_35185, partial [Streptomyces murinus]
MGGGVMQIQARSRGSREVKMIHQKPANPPFSIFGPLFFPKWNGGENMEMGNRNESLGLYPKLSRELSLI